ncbi:MAG TPA: hypothetical protein VMF89_20440, partial [Polyangiales bacterium]|nr:hypothetical protein [Polyangiales bacterium]
KYRWFSSNAAVRIVDNWQSRETTVSATLAACDSYGGDLRVVVTDAIGRKAEGFGAVEFTATRPPRGVCD